CLEALRGLAQVYLDTGQIREAGECFRQALSLAGAAALSVKERAALYHGLGQVLMWKGGFDEVVQLAEAALALLGAGAQTVEAALLLDLIAHGHSRAGRMEQWRAACA